MYIFFSLDHLQKIIMEGDGSPLSSLCMVRAAEVFPKPEPEKEDETLKVPFVECKCIQIKSLKVVFNSFENITQFVSIQST